MTKMLQLPASVVQECATEVYEVWRWCQETGVTLKMTARAGSARYAPVTALEWVEGELTVDGLYISGLRIEGVAGAWAACPPLIRGMLYTMEWAVRPAKRTGPVKARRRESTRHLAAFYAA